MDLKCKRKSEIYNTKRAESQRCGENTREADYQEQNRDGNAPVNSCSPRRPPSRTVTGCAPRSGPCRVRTSLLDGSRLRSGNVGVGINGSCGRDEEGGGKEILAGFLMAQWEEATQPREPTRRGFPSSSTRGQRSASVSFLACGTDERAQGGLSRIMGRCGMGTTGTCPFGYILATTKCAEEGSWSARMVEEKQLKKMAYRIPSHSSAIRRRRARQDEHLHQQERLERYRDTSPPTHVPIRLVRRYQPWPSLLGLAKGSTRWLS